MKFVCRLSAAYGLPEDLTNSIREEEGFLQGTAIPKFDCPENL